LERTTIEYVHMLDGSFNYTFKMEIIKMYRKYRVMSRAILATAMIVPAFIATKVTAENRGWNTSSYPSNYYNYGYNNWNGYNGYNSWTYSYGYG